MRLNEFWSKPWHPEVGFSGTREGMTVYQRMMTHIIFRDLVPSTLHHGDCVGADAQAWRIANHEPHGIFIHAHPCNLPHARAMTHSDMVHDIKPPLVRNHDIVDSSDIMLFTPKEDQPVLRSGTWATFRYALSLKKPMVLIKPSGEAIFYDGGKVVMKSNVSTLKNSTGAALFTVNTTDTGTAVSLDHANNGYFCFYAAGTWGSGTAKLQVSPDDSGTVWIDVASSSMTADGYKVVQVFGRRVRGVVSGNTSASLSLKLVGNTTGLTVTNS